MHLFATPSDTTLRPKYVWVIHGGETWGAELQFEYVAAWAGYVEAYASGGPEWPPGDSVRTVIGIPDSTGIIHLLRCPDGTVLRLD